MCTAIVELAAALAQTQTGLIIICSILCIHRYKPTNYSFMLYAEK